MGGLFPPELQNCDTIFCFVRNLTLTTGASLNQGNELLHEIFDFVPQAEKRKPLSTKEKVCHFQIHSRSLRIVASSSLWSIIRFSLSRQAIPVFETNTSPLIVLAEDVAVTQLRCQQGTHRGDEPPAPKLTVAEDGRF